MKLFFDMLEIFLKVLVGAILIVGLIGIILVFVFGPTILICWTIIQCIIIIVGG